LHNNELYDLYFPTDMIIHTTDPTKHSPAWEADCRSADLEILDCYGSRISFSCSRKPATVHFRESDESGLRSISLRSVLILSPHLRPGLWSVLIFSYFAAKFCMRLESIPSLFKPTNPFLQR
jgi:hypothetical protein